MRNGILLVMLGFVLLPTAGIVARHRWQNQQPIVPISEQQTETETNTSPVSTPSNTNGNAPTPTTPAVTTPASTPTPAPTPVTNLPPVSGGNTVKPAAASGTFTKTIVSGGLTRTYHIHIPTGYDPKKLYPLVFLFHGGNSSGSMIGATTPSNSSGLRMLTDVGFVQKADAEKFIVVAPEGVDGNWNDGRGVTEPELQGIDDVAFVKTLVTTFQTAYAIDSKRIYATGISNGSMMSQRLACEQSSIFASIGAVSGAMPKPISANCTASVSVVGIQGTNDPFSPIPDSDGTPAMTAKLRVGDQTMSVADMQSFWAKEIGCSATPSAVKMPVVVQDGTNVTQYTYPSCNSGRAVVYYIVEGMGHSWPPNSIASLVAITGPSSKNINATDVVWNFFKSHPKS